MLYGEKESIDHILFSCVLANFVWTCVKEACNWNRTPTSLNDFQLNWLEGKRANYYNAILFSFAAFAWALWKCRNRMAIEKDLPRNPMDVIFILISCLQHWRLLTQGVEREIVDCFLRNFEVWRSSTWSTTKAS